MGVVSFLRSRFPAKPLRAVADENGYGTMENFIGWSKGGPPLGTGQASAMKISAVNACVEAITNSVSKLPLFVIDSRTKKHIDHPLMSLLDFRPNEAMNAQTFRKLMEARRLMTGNAYAIAIRSADTARVKELLPVPTDCVTPAIDSDGILWYLFVHPKTGEPRKFRSWDMLHLKAYSSDGITGVSVLSRAAEVVQTAQSQQAYEGKFFHQNARPAGIIKVEGELNAESKERVREAWEKVHSGATGAFRTAVLDLGMEYQPVGMNNSDAQFIESKAVVVEDIARFFGVPLYKLQAGKQSYSSNEQNAIEYVVSTLHPVITQYEQEYTYKLLFDSELRRGLEIKANLNAELRGDFAARAAFYKALRETGVFSVNDIRALEDMQAVEGGDSRYASLNFVPLNLFEELSIKRAEKGNFSTTPQENGGEKNV